MFAFVGSQRISREVGVLVSLRLDSSSIGLHAGCNRIDENHSTFKMNYLFESSQLRDRICLKINSHFLLSML